MSKTRRVRAEHMGGSQAPTEFFNEFEEEEVELPPEDDEDEDEEDDEDLPELPDDEEEAVEGRYLTYDDLVEYMGEEEDDEPLPELPLDEDEFEGMTPYEYLDEVEDQYRDLEEKEGSDYSASTIDASDMTLQEWFDEQGDLYGDQGNQAGEQYIEVQDRQLNELQDHEKAIASALDAIEEAVTALSAADDKVTKALKTMREEEKALAKHFGGKVKGGKIYVAGQPLHLLHKEMQKLGYRQRRQGASPGVAAFSKKTTWAKAKAVPRTAPKSLQKYVFTIEMGMDPKLEKQRYG